MKEKIIERCKYAFVKTKEERKFNLITSTVISFIIIIWSSIKLYTNEPHFYTDDNTFITLFFSYLLTWIFFTLLFYAGFFLSTYLTYFIFKFKF